MAHFCLNFWAFLVVALNEWSINYLRGVVRWERASGGSLSKGTLVFAQTLLFFALSSSSYEIFQHPPPSSFAYCAHVFF